MSLVSVQIVRAVPSVDEVVALSSMQVQGACIVASHQDLIIAFATENLFLAKSRSYEIVTVSSIDIVIALKVSI